MINKRLLVWALRLLFYICLDAVAGTVIYAISVGEPGLTPGQLAIRILTAMGLASAIVGGPDIMLYWQESGRRIKAEEERDAAVENAKTATKERDAAQQERDAEQERATAAEQERAAAIKRADALEQRLDELSAEVAQLRAERSTRRSRRRRLRNNGQ